MFVLSLLKKQLDKILHIFEDANHPLLWPSLKLMKLIGLWHPVMDGMARFKLIIVYMIMAFFCSLYLKCCIRGTLQAFRLLIQYAPFHVAILKAAFFIKDHEKWCEIFGYISSLEREELSAEDPKIKRIIGDYIKYSHRLTYFFWIIAYYSNFSLLFDVYQKVYEYGNETEEYMFDGFTPWSQEPSSNSSNSKHYDFMTQTFFAHASTFYVLAWDPLAVAIMIFFAGQLKVSGIYCERAIDLNSVEATRQNIVECHRFHTTLVKYQEAFHSLISPVMFVYLIVTSVNLGVCITDMVELQDDPTALLTYFNYIFACLIQLLLYYWHSNEVTEESLLVSYSTFKSDWVGADVTVQREVALLAHVTNRRLVFMAGPFNEMSLTTFVSILRGSYSFFTLLNETN